MTLALTEQQERLWCYIRGCERSPSLREMADAMGISSKSGISRMLDALEAKGYVSRVGPRHYRMARSIIANEAPTLNLPPLSCYSYAELRREIAQREARL